MLCCSPRTGHMARSGCWLGSGLAALCRCLWPVRGHTCTQHTTQYPLGVSDTACFQQQCMLFCSVPSCRPSPKLYMCLGCKSSFQLASSYTGTQACVHPVSQSMAVLPPTSAVTLPATKPMPAALMDSICAAELLATYAAAAQQYHTHANRHACVLSPGEVLGVRLWPKATSSCSVTECAAARTCSRPR